MHVGLVADDDKDLDAPTPPGGPQRSDAPSGGHTPGEPAKDPGPEVQRVTRDEGGSVTFGITPQG